MGAWRKARIWAVAALIAAPTRLAADPASPQSGQPSDILAYYPAAAKAAGVSGSATLSCGLTQHGGLTGCKLVSEDPMGQGFGDAALSIAPKAIETPIVDLFPDLRGPKTITFRFSASPPAIEPDVLHHGYLEWTGQAGGAPVRQASSTDAAARPASDYIAQVYPDAARRAGIEGKAVLECSVAADGHVQDCSVAEESPAGYGFGEAALKMSRLFTARPTSAGGKIRIPIEFKMPREAAGAAGGSHPTPTASPPADILAYYPPAAKAAGVGGAATLSCGLTEHGGLVGCKLISEDPKGQGFGDAALSIAAKAPEARQVELLASERGPISITFRFSASPLAIQPDVLSKVHIGGGEGAHPVIITRPDWVYRPSGDQVANYYPASAARAGVNGRALLECSVGADGFLQYCLVLGESPEGYGFGDAALRMFPLFKMRPETRDGFPVEGAKVDIPIAFQMPADAGGGGYAPAYPPDDLLTYYPVAAKAAGISGSATVSCVRPPHGGLAGCSLVSESPGAQGFGQAALAIAAKAVEDVQAVDNPGPMKITFTFKAAPLDIRPDVLRQGWTLVQPTWVRLPTIDEGNYPRAALRAGASGSASLKCHVDGAGELKDCTVAQETPPNLGFGAAALKLAPRFKMKPLTEDGLWTEGASLIIPIDFNLPRS
jgi:TonB family protein